MVDGKLYTVQDRAEERAILDRYIEQMRAQVDYVEPQDRPAVRARITRAEKRRDLVIDMEAVTATQRLLDEDEEILMLMVLH